jgi:hypothetical protein
MAGPAASRAAVAVFNPKPDTNDAYPQARLRIAASVPACMATRHAGPDADGTASPSGV